jgi:hypothetical protein
MITKEQIETFFDDGIFDEWSRGGPEWRAIAMDVKALAQQALAMQQSPIEELDLFGIDDDDVFLVWSKTGRPELRTFSFERGDDPSSEYLTFIRLSSFTKATP